MFEDESISSISASVPRRLLNSKYIFSGDGQLTRAFSDNYRYEISQGLQSWGDAERQIRSAATTNEQQGKSTIVSVKTSRDGGAASAASDQPREGGAAGGTSQKRKAGESLSEVYDREVEGPRTGKTGRGGGGRGRGRGRNGDGGRGGGGRGRAGGPAGGKRARR